MSSGSSSPRRSGSNKNSSSPLLHSLLRTAVSALASDSSSKDRSRSAPSYPEPGHLPRSHTQPEPRRHGDYDPATGIPSHTTPSSSREHTFDLLKTAAYELGKLVNDVEGKIKPSDKDKYRPAHIRSDDDRFEEVSDSETTDSRRRHRHHRSRDAGSKTRSRSVESGRHREHHRGGHADSYYGYPAPATPPTPAAPQYGYNDYTQQFNPAAQTHSYPYPPPAPQQQYNLNHDDSYTHPTSSPQPLYNESSSSSSRPQLKRSKTSASKFAGEMGSELMRNLPALLDKAAWLLSLLEKKNAATGGSRGLGGGHSALLMALGLVMELYRSLGGAEKIRSYNEKRAAKKERMAERY